MVSFTVGISKNSIYLKDGIKTLCELKIECCCNAEDPCELNLDDLVEERIENYKEEFLSLNFNVNESLKAGALRGFNLKGFWLWDTSLWSEKNFYSFPECRELFKLFAIRDLIVERKIVKIIDVEMGNELLMTLFEWQKKLNFKLCLSQKLRPFGFWNKVFYFAAGIFYINKFFYSRRTVLFKRNQREKVSPKSGLAVTYFPNLDEESIKRSQFKSKYWMEVQDLIDEKNNMKWLFLFNPSKQAPSLKAAIRLCQTLESKTPYKFLDEFLGIKDFFKVMISFLFNFLKHPNLTQIKKNFVFKSNDLTFFPMIEKSIYKSIIGNYAASSMIKVQMFSNASGLVGEKYEKIIYLLEGNSWERPFVHYFKKISNDLVGVVHSTARYCDFRLFYAKEFFLSEQRVIDFPHSILINSPLAYDLFVNSHYPPEILRKCEAQRYLHLLDFSVEKGIEKEIDKKKDLLVVTDISKNITGGMVNVIRELLESSNNIRVRFKSHPFYDVTEDIKDLIDNYQVIVENGNLVESCAKADLVYCSNTTSSCFELIYMNKSFVVDRSFDGINDCPLYKIVEINYVQCADDIKSAFEKMEKTVLEKELFYLNKELPMWREELMRVD